MVFFFGSSKNHLQGSNNERNDGNHHEEGRVIGGHVSRPAPPPPPRVSPTTSSGGIHRDGPGPEMIHAEEETPRSDDGRENERPQHIHRDDPAFPRHPGGQERPPPPPRRLPPLPPPRKPSPASHQNGNEGGRQMSPSSLTPSIKPLPPLPSSSSSPVADGATPAAATSGVSSYEPQYEETLNNVESGSFYSVEEGDENVGEHDEQFFKTKHDADTPRQPQQRQELLNVTSSIILPRSAIGDNQSDSADRARIGSSAHLMLHDRGTGGGGHWGEEITPAFATLSSALATRRPRPTRVNNNGGTNCRRFVFLGDKKSVPSELQNLQEQRLRRKHEFLAGIHQLECKIGALTARTAEEAMDRSASLCNVLERAVYEPMRLVMDRLALERDVYKNYKRETNKDRKLLSWIVLENRLSMLDTNMTESTQKTLQSAKHEKLHALHHQLMDGLMPELREDSNKSDKREGGINRRLEENVIGAMTRRYQEERAARVASIEMAAQQVQTMTTTVDKQTVAADGVLATICELRAKLRKERQEREEQDKRVLERVIQTTSALKRALIEIIDSDPGEKKE